MSKRPSLAETMRQVVQTSPEQPAQLRNSHVSPGLRNRLPRPDDSMPLPEKAKRKSPVIFLHRRKTAQDPCCTTRHRPRGSRTRGNRGFARQVQRERQSGMKTHS